MSLGQPDGWATNVLKTLFIGLFTSVVLISSTISGQQNSSRGSQVRQSAEVVEAYRVCREFQQLLGENLDFDRAFEAAFVKDVAHRRAIAISDGEFGDQKFEDLDSGVLINAYKLRMQLLYLMLPLAGPDDSEVRLFFPPEIKAILDRHPSVGKVTFEKYVEQLERDVARFRTHLDQLGAKYSSVSARILAFKTELKSAALSPPVDRKVEPQREYIGQEQTNRPYYEIDSYRVVDENGKMRIAGLRFFTRLF